jgi:hypothetical protein
VALAATAAAAEPARVLLVRPAQAQPSTTEALTRIRGELIADGFAVELVSPPPAGAPEEVLARALDQPGSAALVGLSLDPDAHSAELWVVDRLTDKRLTRRIDIGGEPPDRVAQVLAVRSVELLRASLLELLIDAQRPTEGPRVSPVATAPQPSEGARLGARRWVEKTLPATRLPPWALDAGASVLASPQPSGGIGPAALFTGRVRFAPIPPLQVRLTFAGLGTAPRVAGPQGSSATVSQLLALAEIAWLPWPELRARPILSLGGGTLRVAVDGEASLPYRGTHSAVWCSAADAGTGVEVRIAPRLGVAVEGHVFVALPYPVVRFLDDPAARGASPGLLGSVTLVGWL